MKRRNFIKFLGGVGVGSIITHKVLNTTNDKLNLQPVTEYNTTIAKYSPKIKEKEFSEQEKVAREYLIKNRNNYPPEIISERLDVHNIYKKIYGYSANQVINLEGHTLNLALANPSFAYMIKLYAKQEKVNLKLFNALAIPEANYGTNTSKSSAGAISHLQVMPNILRRMGLDPDKTEDHYIGSAKLIKEYGRILNIDVSENSKLKPEEIVLIGASYNAGPTAVKNKTRTVLFKYKETKKHVPYVLSAMLNFNFIIPEKITQNQDGLWVATKTRII